jgi:hypothetical protein
MGDDKRHSVPENGAKKSKSSKLDILARFLLMGDATWLIPIGNGQVSNRFSR